MRTFCVRYLYRKFPTVSEKYGFRGGIFERKDAQYRVI